MKISLYTTPNCPQCRISKRMFDEAQVEYEVIDLSENAEAMAMVKELGYSQAPVIITDNKHWSGFRHNLMSNTISEYRASKAHAA